MINYLRKWKQENRKLSNISDKFSSNDLVAKQMLELLNNKTTKIKVDNDIKNNYYVFLTDTIYLSNKEVNKNGYQRICVMAHECIHSIQSKTIQTINFILSNIELIAFVITFICMVIKFNVNIVFYSYMILNIISVIPRIILELNATLKSINLTKKYIEDKVEDNETNTLLNSYKKQIILFLPLFIVSLLLGRFFRFLIIYITMII